MQQRNALNVIYSPLRSATTRRLSLHFTVPACWRFLAAPQAHPRPTLRRSSSGTDGCNPSIRNIHSPLESIRGRRLYKWRALARYVSDVFRCALQLQLQLQIQVRFYADARIPRLLSRLWRQFTVVDDSARYWACKLGQSVWRTDMFVYLGGNALLFALA